MTALPNHPAIKQSASGASVSFTARSAPAIAPLRVLNQDIDLSRYRRYGNRIFSLRIDAALELLDSVDDLISKDYTLRQALEILTVPESAYRVLDKYRQYLGAVDSRSCVLLKGLADGEPRIALSILAYKIAFEKEHGPGLPEFEGGEMVASLCLRKPGDPQVHLHIVEQERILAVINNIRQQYGDRTAKIFISNMRLSDKLGRWEKKFNQRAKIQQEAIENGVEVEEPRFGPDTHHSQNVEPDPNRDEFRSTEAAPGSMEKLDELKFRLDNGLPLWHSDDRSDYEKLNARDLPFLSNRGKD